MAKKLVSSKFTLKKWQKYYVILTLLCLNTFVQPVQGGSLLKVAFGNSLPPWVFPEQHNGILVDLASIALQEADYQIQPVYYPYARRIKAYKNGQVDVVTDMTPNVVIEEKLEGYLSIPFYYYENIAISLTERQFIINSIKDLTSLRVLAWQGAMHTLSHEYAAMASENPFYKETHNQESQIEMLFKNRTDVIQLDTKIFSYFHHKLASEGKIDKQLSVDYAPILERNYCAFLFRDKNIRDEFNARIKVIQADTKQYQSIYMRYVNPLLDVSIKKPKTTPDKSLIFIE